MRSVHGVKRDASDYESYKELVKAIWPRLNTDKKKSIFKPHYLEKFSRGFEEIVVNGKKIGVPDNSIPDYFYQSLRARYFIGQISFFMSNSNPRFDVLYSPKAAIMALFLDKKLRKANLIGFNIMDDLVPGLKNLPFDVNKFSVDYINLKGPVKEEDFQSNYPYKEFTNFKKFKVDLRRDNKANLKKNIDRANLLKATLWQVTEEETAKKELKRIFNSMPKHFKEENFNMKYINHLINERIRDRIDLRALHTLHRNLIWYEI